LVDQSIFVQNDIGRSVIWLSNTQGMVDFSRCQFAKNTGSEFGSIDDDAAISLTKCVFDAPIPWIEGTTSTARRPNPESGKFHPTCSQCPGHVVEPIINPVNPTGDFSGVIWGPDTECPWPFSGEGAAWKMSAFVYMCIVLGTSLGAGMILLSIWLLMRCRGRHAQLKVHPTTHEQPPIPSSRTITREESRTIDEWTFADDCSVEYSHDPPEEQP
jgi:hypothetical protein